MTIMKNDNQKKRLTDKEEELMQLKLSKLF